MSFYDYTPMRRVAETPAEFVRRYQSLELEQTGEQSATRVSSLASSYESARNAYLWRCGVPFCHPSLQFPFLFFYLEDPKAERPPICHVSPFLCDGRYTNRMTKQTFPAFLVNCCSIPYLPGDKAEQFYSCLEALLCHAPQNRLRLIQQELEMISPAFSGWRTLDQAIWLSRDKNLFVSAGAVRKLTPDRGEDQDYISVLELDTQGYLPAPLMRQYLEAYREQAGEERCIPEPRVQADTILYHRAGSEGPPVLLAVYRAESDSFVLRTQTPARFSVKTMPLDHISLGQSLPEGILPLFRRLCGCGDQALDQLAKVLAQAVDPARGGVTVVYTRRHKQMLTAVLERLFGSCAISSKVFTRHPKAEESMPSFNQLTKGENLIHLFLGQCGGAGVVLVSDLAPSEVSLQTLRRLLAGKALTVSNPACPSQVFHSNLHFVCITDRPERAQLLEKKLKAEVVDLSCVELPAQEQTELSPEAVHWLRTAFLLHGLKLHTLSDRQSGDENGGPAQPASPSLQEEIGAFLSQGCEKGEMLYCDTGRLYQGFLQFHLQRHPGTEAPVSKICFNKAVRELIAQENELRITYKKLRPGPQEPPRWYYTGVDLLPADVRSSGTPVQLPEEETLEQRLLSIHRRRLPL